MDVIGSQCECKERMPQTERDIHMTDADQQGVSSVPSRLSNPLMR